MKIYLVSNNLLLENIKYKEKDNLDLIRMVRPLSTDGERTAKKLSENERLVNIEKIYSSFYSASLDSAKYLKDKLEVDIIMDVMLNECKVGDLNNKNMKMVKGMQDHDFSYKLVNGESLLDVGNRINYFINNIINKNEECIIYTHKRAILGFLLKYSKVGYNLDDNLILEYNSKIIYDDSETDIDFYELTILNKEIIDISRI